MRLFEVHHAAVTTRAHATTIVAKMETNSGGDRTWDIRVLQRMLSSYVLRGVVAVQNIYFFSWKCSTDQTYEIIDTGDLNESYFYSQFYSIMSCLNFLS